MEFKAKSEKEIKESMLVPEGDYDFDVLEAWDTKSRKGNDMIKINLGLYRGDAIGARLFDYLVPTMEFKLRHFCDSTGLLAKYEAGTLCAADCVGRSGKVTLIVKSDPQYGEQNSVKDYVCRPGKPLAHSPTAPEPPPPPPPDDDIPF